jgi:RNase P/RNase MRP subunit p30
MLLKIHQRKADKNNTELYRKAVGYFADQLLSKARQKKLKLTIIIKHFKGAAKKESAACTQVSRNRYVIEINRAKSFPTIISALAHEMVHVKQGVMGKLLMTTVGFKWKGKLFRSERYRFQQRLL